VQTACL